MDFTRKENCERCCEPIGKVTRMSWYTTEMLCMNCTDAEDAFRRNLTNKHIALEHHSLEGCGFVPDGGVIPFTIALDIKRKY